MTYNRFSRTLSPYTTLLPPLQIMGDETLFPSPVIYYGAHSHDELIRVIMDIVTYTQNSGRYKVT